MATEVKTTVYAVGQGSCNLIEVWEDDRLIHLTLIDCGTLSSINNQNSQEIKVDVEQIYEEIKDKAIRRFEDSHSYYFDEVIITHQDTDHWSLIMNLLDKIILDLDKVVFLKADDWKSFMYNDGYVHSNDIINKHKYYILYKKDQYYIEITKEMNLTNLISPYNCSSYDIKYKKDEISILESIQINEQDKAYKISLSLSNKKDKIFSFVGNCTSFPNKGITIINIYTLDLEKFNSIFSNYVPMFNSYKNFAEKFCEITKNYLQKQKIEDDFDEGFGSIDVYIAKLEKNITIDLLNIQCNARKKIKCRIDKFYYGGHEELFTDSFKKCKNKLMCVSNQYSYFTNKIDIWVDDIHVKGLFIMRVDEVASVYQDELTPELKNNLTSAIIGIFYRESLMIFPGDATAHTMHGICKKHKQLALWPSNTVVELLVAPHHGSDITSKDSGSQYKILEEFLSILKPKAIYISSGWKNKFGHPGENFVEYAINAISDIQKIEHEIFCQSKTGKIESGNGKKYDFKVINKNVYTTVVCDKFYSDLTYTLSESTIELSAPINDIQKPDEAKLEQLPKPKYRKHTIPPAHLFIR